jgi:hypothetical protein
MKLSTAILAWLIFGGIGILCAVLTVSALVRGEPLTALVTLCGAAFCFGMITPLAKVVRGQVFPRGAVEGRGTTFRPDRGIDIPVQVSLTALVVGSILILVLMPSGRLDITVPPFMRYSLPFTCGVLVLIGVPMIWRNLRRGSTKYLRLTPDGFELAQGWRSQSGDWDEVREVTDEAPAQQAPTPGSVVFVMSDGAAPTIAAGAITPDGKALRELVRFYWQHPESRGELTDSGAYERLARALRDAG